MSEMDKNLLYGSALVSVLSIVHGQIMVLSAQKNGFLGLKAKLLMLVYQPVAALPRGYIFFASLRSAATYSYIGYVPMIVTAVVILLHICLSCTIQVRFFQEDRNIFIQALNSVLAPSLGMDWDKLFRKHNYTLPVKKCWKKTQITLLLSNLLSFCGNLAIGISLMVTRSFTIGFDLQLAFGTAAVSPAILIGLAYFYFKTCHPWARILKAELSSSQEMTNTRESQGSNGEMEEDAPLQGQSEPGVSLEVGGRLL